MSTDTTLSAEAFQAKMLQLQAEFMAKLQAAQAAQDMAAVQSLSADFQKQVADLSAHFQNGSAAAAPSESAPPPAATDPAAHLYDNSACRVDLNMTVYDGERNMLLALLSDTHFMELTEEILKDDPDFNSRKHLLKRSLRLSPAIAPMVHEVLKTCRERLGLTVDLDLYVYQDTAFNASCYPSKDNRIYVLLTSALLERFTKEELTFVLGHEIGHALMNHHRFPVRWLLEKGRGHYSPLQALRLYSWNRGCELTCDRVGLLCGRNFEAAGHAFFKLSSGITDEHFSFQLQDYIKQFEDLSTELKNSTIDPEDMYSSHPFSPLRLKALEIFWKSETYRALIGESGGEISEAAMEEQIRGFMSLVEPVALQEGSDGVIQQVKEFIFLAGYSIAAANGAVEKQELQALASVLDPLTVQQGLNRVQTLNSESLWAELDKLAESLNMAMPTVSKLNLLRDLAVISASDGTIEPVEVDLLYGCSDKLRIRREFIDKVLDEMTRPAA